ncbi:MAG: hypothetical protein AAB594_01705 [Patescibacteria group bacterium]
MKNSVSNRGGLIRDLAIVALSVFVAVNLAGSGAVEKFLVNTEGLVFLGSFLAGLFFVSIFTVAPAMVAIVEIAKTGTPLWELAIFGGLGAMLGDLLIFRFVRDRISEDISKLIEGRKGRWLKIFKFKSFRWVAAFLGAVVVASPLPDELGLAMMGFSKMKTTTFLPLSFILNSAGILVIGILSRL